MFRKLNYLLGLIAMLYCTQVQAQTNNSSPVADSTRLKWEIATDLLWLIDKNQIPASNIFLRKHVTRSNGKLGAWRLRVGGNVSKQDDKASPLEAFQNRYSFESRVGYEWQKHFKKSQVYYGVDFQSSYSYEKIKRYPALDLDTNGNVIEGLRWDEKYNAFQLGLVGVIGAKYQFSKHFSMSIESTVILNYTYSKRKGDRTKFPIDDASDDFGIDADYRYMNMFFTPISVVNFSYHF
jgi:hypothetical protein